MRSCIKYISNNQSQESQTLSIIQIIKIIVMLSPESLIDKQQTRRSKVRTIHESIEGMERTITDQQARIKQLEDFVLWIYQVSAEGKSNPTIVTAIQNFHSGSSVSSVEKKSENVSEKPEQSQKNLTFFPISAQSSLSRYQTFSVQSVPMNQSKIQEIHHSEDDQYSIKSPKFEMVSKRSKGAFVRPDNKENRLLAQK